MYRRGRGDFAEIAEIAERSGIGDGSAISALTSAFSAVPILIAPCGRGFRHDEWRNRAFTGLLASPDYHAWMT